MTEDLKKAQKGFTLVEILAVIFIIGILFLFTVPRLNSFTTKSEIGSVETDIRLLKSNIQEHFVNNPTQPLTEDLLQEYFGTEVELVSSSPTADPTYYRLPNKKDPWGNPYEVIVGRSELFVAFHSFGPNGVNNIQSGLNATNIKDDIIALYYPRP